MTTTHEYQYDINSLLAKDEAGAISSFALQLDSILSDNEPLNETGIRLLDETIRLLHDLISDAQQSSSNEYEESYMEGYGDCENGFHPKY